MPKTLILTVFFKSKFTNSIHLYKVRPAKIFFQGYSDFQVGNFIFEKFFSIKSINWKGEEFFKEMKK